jgi:alkylation response protein AidB-like acyl-CoA dehydrogenase
MYSTQCAQDTARDAVQLFGGRGITQTGMGRFIEHAIFLKTLGVLRR